MRICEETKTRVKTALLLGIGAAAILFFSDRPLVARLAALGLSAFGVAEILTGMRVSPKWLRILLAFFAEGFALAVFFWKSPWSLPTAALVFGIGLLAFGVPEVGLARQKRIPRAAVCPFAFLIPVLYSATYQLSLLPQGRAMLCAVVLTCTVNDIAAYFIGRRFGRHRLSPHVSPHKTVEGALGGLCCAVGGGLLLLWIACLIFGWRANFPLAAALFACIALTGQLGDLATSSLKRILGLKDFGRLFPGHGGILDRFDSQLFAAPAAVLFSLLFGSIFLG